MAEVRLALVQLIGRPLSPPGSGEFPCVAVLAQRYTLMGNNAQFSARLSGAQQGKPSLSILLKVPPRVRLVYLSCNDAGGAADAPALLTDAREIQPRSAGSAENVLLGADLERAYRAIGEPYPNGEALRQ
jgi:hypothetical protein